MGRQFDRKRRDKQKRRPKPLILLVAEGTNMTESQYFRSFQNQNAEYTIKVLKPGHRTDPYKLNKHYDSIDCVWPSNQCNPRTDVPKIIDAMGIIK